MKSSIGSTHVAVPLSIEEEEMIEEYLNSRLVGKWDYKPEYFLSADDIHIANDIGMVRIASGDIRRKAKRQLEVEHSVFQGWLSLGEAFLNPEDFERPFSFTPRQTIFAMCWYRRRGPVAWGPAQMIALVKLEAFQFALPKFLGPRRNAHGC